MSVREYKDFKNLKKENLRDNMTNIELTLNQLAEVTTTAISRQEKPKSFNENKKVANVGGQIAKNTRNDIEKRLGKSVISPINAKNKKLLEVNEDNNDN